MQWLAVDWSVRGVYGAKCRVRRNSYVEELDRSLPTGCAVTADLEQGSRVRRILSQTTDVVRGCSSFDPSASNGGSSRLPLEFFSVFLPRAHPLMQLPQSPIQWITGFSISFGCKSLPCRVCSRYRAYHLMNLRPQMWGMASLLIILVFHMAGLVCHGSRSIGVGSPSTSSATLLIGFQNRTLANKVFSTPFRLAKRAISRSLHSEKVLRAYVM